MCYHCYVLRIEMGLFCTCKGFGDVVFLPFPGLVVFISWSLVVLRQPAAFLALLVNICVHQAQTLASLVFVRCVVELHTALCSSSSRATL